MSASNLRDSWSRSNPYELQVSDILSDGDTSSEVDDIGPGGDYSARMAELFEGVDPESIAHKGEDDDDEDEEFLYEGVDSSAVGGYDEQLREVLGEDSDEEGETGTMRTGPIGISSPPFSQDENARPTLGNDHSPTESLNGNLTPELGEPSSAGLNVSDFKLARPFLHPTVSRLRSYTPQLTNLRSNDSSATSHSHLYEGVSPSPSHFSSLSRISSVSNARSVSSTNDKDAEINTVHKTRRVFKWTDLHIITRTMFSKASQKASHVLGAPLLGFPTTLAANGLVCIGTTEGKVVVHDFSQSLICVCESKTLGSALGPVTAIALSHDQTFVASGHASGYIQLYNLKQPHNPVRSVPPTTLIAVSSGRKEGHIQGSRIVSVGFIAGRHTALVSADEHGLSFFHSLGKILFVEASDILRILGRYPESIVPASSATQSKLQNMTTSVPTFFPREDSQGRRKSRHTVLAMSPLPLGSVPYSTDSHYVVALLTPTKLVVVGLKPTPRTWFKCPREPEEGGQWKSKSKWVGTLAWYPSILRPGYAGEEAPNNMADSSTAPMLVYSWGSSMHLIKVYERQIKQTVNNSKTGKNNEIEIGAITYEQTRKWNAHEDILALQWLNHNQVVVITHNNLGIYDIKLSRLVEQAAFNSLTLVSPRTHGDDDPGQESHIVSHSIRVYKGKIFVLKKDRLMVGTLLTWADLILSLVENGDFLQAIDLARSYYTGEAPGNRNNLPDDDAERKVVVGEKLRSLMDASAQYAFSEDRMTDNTHSTPDNRGVDRTSVFEGLVSVCCRASVALGDFEYLFEDLFQKYDDSGIASIYLRQLEPFILGNQIRYVPPRITQRLVALHQQDGRPEYVERIIWHMDPSCLDLNQAIHLCQRFHLYDALIFIYTSAMRDYVAPVVELLGLIRKVQQFRKLKSDLLIKTGSVLDANSSMESTIINAYKIYPYLSNVLSGLTYPSEEPLNGEDAYKAKRDIYNFVFFGRSSVWPPGDGGMLVLTSNEEGGIEPTYPYARQLLLFDSESFLHSLDIAFEDAYLNDESQTINRSIIVRIILEIVASGQLPQEDITMVNIFIARNVPKYPQFLHITSSSLHSVLIGLAADLDPKTREDRQLAAEYLLSAYNPHDSERIAALFERAGFFRILRTWHYHEKRWTKLLSTYIDDPDISSRELIGQIATVITDASKAQKGHISDDLVVIVSKSLPRLLRVDIPGTARMIDTFIPDLHQKALESFGGQANADHSRYEYLRSVLFDQSNEEDVGDVRLRRSSEHLPTGLHQTFFDLECQFHPTEVIPSLQALSLDNLHLDEILETCEIHQVYDAVIWATNWQGRPQKALSKAETFQTRIMHTLLTDLKGNADSAYIDQELSSLQAIANVCKDICMEHSQYSSSDVPLEDMWFELLNSEIRCVQTISSSAHLLLSKCSTNEPSDHLHGNVEKIMTSLRTLVQATFSSLVSITSTSAVSFPRLFKRLVNATPSSSGAHYTEFRMILLGMLESYRSDEDLLLMLKHLIDRDLFDTIERVTRERACGWAAVQAICQFCRQPFGQMQGSGSMVIASKPITISRTGIIFHEGCKPTPDVVHI
ncbi:Vacuolar protein sorting-associated protein 8-like protein [Psilocybe cubensis]|uniref:Vacuolar protein sorting-associated protein 8-like protein n=2 Tax=Psilocybe cubensis TaxID=181762 RepID=A0ACB8HE52_PSICU|nr:Vacuolar protein sorting-associated protein 8-like protein [Psilocybe cubensis]KAH9485420.1 Vacuolar protein sorting-associated protein 8-like protein [Psilocybe cubensis]